MAGHSRRDVIGRDAVCKSGQAAHAGLAGHKGTGYLGKSPGTNPDPTSGSTETLIGPRGLPHSTS